MAKLFAWETRVRQLPCTPMGLTACNRFVLSMLSAQGPVPGLGRAPDNEMLFSTSLSGSCQMPDSATKTDGRNCSGPFQRPLIPANPTFQNGVSSFSMFKTPILISVFMKLAHESLFYSLLASLISWFILILPVSCSYNFFWFLEPDLSHSF